MACLWMTLLTVALPPINSECRLLLNAAHQLVNEEISVRAFLGLSVQEA